MLKLVDYTAIPEQSAKAVIKCSALPASPSTLLVAAHSHPSVYDLQSHICS